MSTSTTTNPIEEAVERLVAFIVERESVRRKKEAGEPWPWTDDEILREYRFCCVHREDDAVTRWITHCWRSPRAKEVDLWHLMVMARLFNDPDTLFYLDCELSHEDYHFDMIRTRLLSAIRRRQKEGKRIFNPAYMITTAGQKMDKIKYIFQMLDTLWAARERLRPKEGDTLCSYHMLLGQFQGLGSFLAGQVVADLRYVEPLRSASDWQTFAASGPGSRRGMNRVLGRSVNSPWDEEDWRSKLGKLLVKTAHMLRRHKIELHGQDLQNCLCEFDKYERARLGEGRPKQRYRHGEKA